MKVNIWKLLHMKNTSKYVSGDNTASLPYGSEQKTATICKQKYLFNYQLKFIFKNISSKGKAWPNMLVHICNLEPEMLRIEGSGPV